MEEISHASTRVEHSLAMDYEVIHMPIFMQGLDKAIAAVARDEILMKVAAPPKLLADYLLGCIVYVVNRR